MSGAEGDVSPSRKVSPPMPSVIEGGQLLPGPVASPIMSPAEEVRKDPATPVESSSVSLPPSAEARGDEEEVFIERVRAATPARTGSSVRELVSVNYVVW